jgi:hypothetical protein
LSATLDVLQQLCRHYDMAADRSGNNTFSKSGGRSRTLLATPDVLQLCWHYDITLESGSVQQQQQQQQQQPQQYQ